MVTILMHVSFTDVCYFENARFGFAHNIDIVAETVIKHTRNRFYHCCFSEQRPRLLKDGGMNK